MRWPWSKKTLDLPPVAEIVDEAAEALDGLLRALVADHHGCLDLAADIDHNGPRLADIQGSDPPNPNSETPRLQ